MTATTIIILLGSLICYTIKRIESLHRLHNYLVVNVMIADIILTLWSTIPASIAIVGNAAGTDSIHYRLTNFTSTL